MEQAVQLYHAVMESQERNQILSAAIFFLGIVFLFGLLFGRVTKRVNREIKNK